MGLLDNQFILFGCTIGYIVYSFWLILYFQILNNRFTYKSLLFSYDSTPANLISILFSFGALIGGVLGFKLEHKK